MSDPRMTLADVAERFAEIREVAWDLEHAHELEEALLRDVLTAIAEGHEAPAELAGAVLKASQTKFNGLAE